MARDARFWRNVAIIAVAHVAIFIGLIRWNRETRKANPQSIVWMSGGLAIERPAPAEKEIEASSLAPATPPVDRQEAPEAAAIKSEIELPFPTPVATPAPKPSAKPTPEATARPTPKATPKKSTTPKSTPEPSPKKKPTPAKKEKADGDEGKKEAPKVAPDKALSADQARQKAEADRGNAGSSGSEGRGSGTARASEFGWYGKMLHDRFYKEWAQPTTVVSTGAKMSVLVRIRIEKDGRVSNFTIVKPSGNVVVDESVAAVAKRVTQVDALPQGLVNGDHYDVQVNFELNPER